MTRIPYDYKLNHEFKIPGYKLIPCLHFLTNSFIADHILLRYYKLRTKCTFVISNY